MALVANAPYPPFGDLQTSKNSVIKIGSGFLGGFGYMESTEEPEDVRECKESEEEEDSECSHFGGVTCCRNCWRRLMGL